MKGLLLTVRTILSAIFGIIIGFGIAGILKKMGAV